MVTKAVRLACLYSNKPLAAHHIHKVRDGFHVLGVAAATVRAGGTAGTSGPVMADMIDFQTFRHRAECGFIRDTMGVRPAALATVRHLSVAHCHDGAGVGPAGVGPSRTIDIYIETVLKRPAVALLQQHEWITVVAPPTVVNLAKALRFERLVTAVDATYLRPDD